MPDNQQGKFRWVRHLFRPGKPLPGADDPPMYSWGDILFSLFMGVVMLPILRCDLKLTARNASNRS